MAAAAMEPRPAAAPAPATTSQPKPATPTGAPPPAPGGGAMPAVDLGAGSVAITDDLLAYLDAQPKKDTGPVHARLGSLASGTIQLRKAGKDKVMTPGSGPQCLALNHPALAPLTEVGVVPQLAVKISDEGKIEGYATVAGARKAKDLADTVTEHAAALGWAGLDLQQVTPKSAIEDGTLVFEMPEVPFAIKGVVKGSLAFGLKGEAVTFTASGTINIPKQQPADVSLIRDENGKLSASADVPIELGKLSGSLHASYSSDGPFEVRGTIGLQMEKYSGEVTVILADAATAREAALSQLGDAVLKKEAESAKAEKRGGKEKAKPAKGGMTLVGWGTVNIALTDWLSGKATVIVDDDGDVTLVGEIAPPAEVELFEQRDYVKPLFKIEAEASYGLPVIGNIFLFANIGMEALAKLGPGKLHEIKLNGTYSTKPEVAKSFSIAGTLTISAFAGLRLRAEGGAGTEIVDHDIKAGVGVNGLAGVKGYVSATPKIGMREVGDPLAGKKTEFYVKGHMEIAAQPFVGLAGDLFVELDSPWWSPAPDKKWTWPIGQLEYPLPGEFGIGADVDYVLGSKQLPEVKFGEVSFDSSKFITDMVNDKVAPKSKGEQDKPGTWKEAETAPAPGEGQGKVTAGAGAEGPAGQAKPDPALASAKANAEEKAKKAGPDGGAVRSGLGDPTGDAERGTADEQREYAKGTKALGDLLEWAIRDEIERKQLEDKADDIKRDFKFASIQVSEDADEWVIVSERSPKVTQKVKKKLPLTPYEVGRFKDLPTKRYVFEAHHIPQTVAARAYFGSYSRSNAPAIVLPYDEHRKISNLREAHLWEVDDEGHLKLDDEGNKIPTVTPWDILERDLDNLAVYSNAPPQQISRLTQMVESEYGELRGFKFEAELE